MAGPTMFTAPEIHGLPSYNQPQWASFLSTCEELEVPLSFHIGVPGGGAQKAYVEPGVDGSDRLTKGRGVHLATYTTNSFFSNSWLITNFIFSGIPAEAPPAEDCFGRNRHQLVTVPAGGHGLPVVREHRG